jgi:hypothetical protein
MRRIFNTTTADTDAMYAVRVGHLGNAIANLSVEILAIACQVERMRNMEKLCKIN